jgi:hypothetical protein
MSKIKITAEYVAQRKRDGKWFARVKGKDANGKPFDKTKFGYDKAYAEWLLQALKLGIDAERDDGDWAVISFSRVLDDYIALRVTDAAYRGDKKISGLRSHGLWRQDIKLL